LYPDVEFIYSYGLTEASPRVTYITTKKLLEKPQSSGVSISGVSVRIVDNKLNDVEENIIGQIGVIGPNIMLGYYNKSELSASVICDEMLLTGDLGYVDKDGFLYVVGRTDNMIIQSGKNIYPEEIEKVLLQNDRIFEAIVMEEIEESVGHVLVAYIVVKKDEQISKKEIIAYCACYLEDYKIPRKIVFLEELPKNPNGKIMRGRL